MKHLRYPENGVDERTFEQKMVDFSLDIEERVSRVEERPSNKSLLERYLDLEEWATHIDEERIDQLEKRVSQLEDARENA